MVKTEILTKEKQELEKKFEDQVTSSDAKILDLQNQINELKATEEPAITSSTEEPTVTPSTEETTKYTTIRSAAATFANGQTIFHISYIISLLIISNYFIN